MTRWAATGWAMAALVLAEAGARDWPLMAGGLMPLALALLLAAAARVPVPGGGPGLTGPQGMARLAMLPMMAAVPAMGDWCGSSGGPLWAMTGLHLGAMLLPAWLPLPRREGACRALLLAGGAALWLPGVQGLMLAAVLHALAAGLACGVAGAAGRPGRRSLLPALLVASLGLALERWGPAALVAGHAALALTALLPSAGFMARLSAVGRSASAFGRS